jgi:hypothetical protein
MIRLGWALAIPLILSLSVRAAAPSFLITVGDRALDQPVAGRLLVFVVGPDRPLRAGESPGSWDFCDEPMPIYATSVSQIKAGDAVRIDDSSDHYLAKLSDLPAGDYSAMAVLDWHDDASGWDMEPGNVSSKVVSFRVRGTSGPEVKLALDQVVSEQAVKPQQVEIVEIRSELLSDFRGRDVYLRAGVVKPLLFDPAKSDASYSAIYEVPGFGGRHFDASAIARKRTSLKDRPSTPSRKLAMQTFYIVLDPESPNGHTLFADSEVNGPYGRALTEELIPELEKRYPLIADVNHRIITGHSSGGWSTCWLATQYPDVFGGAWPSSPDPLDFRRFELVDIYSDKSFYERDGKDIPSTRDLKNDVTITVRQEAMREEIFSKGNASAQQWDSWQAVWGSSAGNFRPKSLWDPMTGEIDRKEVGHYQRYDLSLLLRNDPAKYSPIWRERIRLVVGDMDDYYLNEAVAMLKDELAKLPATGNEKANKGYIKIVPGKTHGSVYGTKEMRNFDAEMLEFLNDGK